MKQIPGFIILFLLVIIGIMIKTYFKESPSQQLKENIDIIRIDNCEYLHYENTGKIYFTHKGNCNNPIHYE